jgi:hypothetical protein
MAWTVSWVNGKLGRGQSENEPASARVSRRHAQYVCEERAHLRGIRGKHDGMYSRDHTAILTVDPAVAVMYRLFSPVLAAMRCRKADTSGVGLVTDTRSEARHPGLSEWVPGTGEAR